MRTFGKVPTEFWAWVKEHGVSATARYIGAYLYSNEQANSLGCYKLPPELAAFDLGESIETVSQAYQELFEGGLIRYCPASGLVWVRNWLKHNPSQNNNHAKGIADNILSLPESFVFIKELSQKVRQYDPRIFDVRPDAIDTLAKRYRNIEIEMEIEKERKTKDSCPPASGGTPPSHSVESPKEKPSTNPRNTHQYTQAFENIWASVHPDMRKCGKLAASKAHKRAQRISDYPGDEDIILILQAEAGKWNGQTDPFVPHLTTWFNEGRWDIGTGLEARKAAVQAEQDRTRREQDAARKAEAEKEKAERDARIKAAWDQLPEGEQDQYIEDVSNSSDICQTLYRKDRRSSVLVLTAMNRFAERAGLAGQ